MDDVEIVEVLAPPVSQDIIRLSDESDIGSDMGIAMDSDSSDPGYNISKGKGRGKFATSRQRISSNEADTTTTGKQNPAAVSI